MHTDHSHEPLVGCLFRLAVISDRLQSCMRLFPKTPAGEDEADKAVLHETMLLNLTSFMKTRATLIEVLQYRKQAALDDALKPLWEPIVSAFKILRGVQAEVRRDHGAHDEFLETHPLEMNQVVQENCRAELEVAKARRDEKTPGYTDPAWSWGPDAAAKALKGAQAEGTIRESLASAGFEFAPLLTPWLNAAPLA